MHGRWWVSALFACFSFLLFRGFRLRWDQFTEDDGVSWCEFSALVRSEYLVAKVFCVRELRPITADDCRGVDAVHDFPRNDDSGAYT